MTQFKCRGDSDSSSSEDDQEALVRLREAVDSETLKDNFYSQKSKQNKPSHNDTACHPFTPLDKSGGRKIAQNEDEHDDPKTLYLNTKKILERNKKNCKTFSKA